MGEPAIPNAAERASTLELAKKIVDCVREDRDIIRHEDVTVAVHGQLELFQLAQLVTLQEEQLAAARKVVETWDAAPRRLGRALDELAEAIDELEEVICV
jgi:hypothetical protein